MKIGIVITRAANLDVTWTTIHLAVAALEAGHVVRFVERDAFEVDERASLVARAFAFDEPTSAALMVRGLRTRTARRVYADMRKLDRLLLRSAPLTPAA